MSTHLNWGTSYLVHDCYRRFLKPGASERHYVAVARLVTAGLMLAAALFSLVLDSARQAFDLLLSVGAGTGLLYLLRWFWWRINAWSEIAAMVSSFVVAAGFALAARGGAALPSHVVLLTSVGITTVVWFGVTLLTPPTDPERLADFYRLVRPAGPGWTRLRAATQMEPSPDSLPLALLGWVMGVAFVYASLFGAGNLLYGHSGPALACGVVALGSGLALWRVVPRLWGARDR